MRYLLLLLPALAWAGPEADLRTYYRDVEALSGEFVQRLQDDDGSTLERYEGRFWLQRPGRFLWVYESPYPLELGSDGVTLWHFDVDLRQITLRDAAAALSGTPAELLGGELAQLDRYRITPQAPADGLDWLELTPEQAESDFATIRIGLKGGEPRQMELADRLGQLTVIRFENLKRNPEIAAERFTLQVPDKTTVVDERPEQ